MAGLLMHERVNIAYEVWTGEFNSRGNKVMETVTAENVPAAVWSLGSSNSDFEQGWALTRYRVALGRRVGEIPPSGWSSFEITWGEYGTTLPPLKVDGTIDSIRMNGRTHHYELTTQSLTP